jgi:hypothetical protein
MFRWSLYCVEKLDSSGYSINFNEQDHCNLLFLLNDVSAETCENRRKGVFQHNTLESGTEPLTAHNLRFRPFSAPQVSEA